MANNIYNKQVTPKGYKRGGGVKKPGKVKSFFGKIRKKIVPTFGEQGAKARKEGKKVFRSTRDDTKKGNLYYSSKTADQVKVEKKRMSDRERARVGDKSKQLSDKGAAFKLARKMGKKTYTHKGKIYTTDLKGEKPNKIMPELSGKTSKKIKKFIGA